VYVFAVVLVAPTAVSLPAASYVTVPVVVLVAFTLVSLAVVPEYLNVATRAPTCSAVMFPIGSYW